MVLKEANKNKSPSGSPQRDMIILMLQADSGVYTEAAATAATVAMAAPLLYKAAYIYNV